MTRFAAVVAIAASCVTFSTAFAQGSANHTFSFNAPDISGFPSGAVSLTGGGTFDAASGFVHAGGSFSCTRDINQGPLAGCKAGQGIRWDSAEIVSSFGIKCSGALSEPAKLAVTGNTAIVLKADFYRAGDGTHESFTANMVVSSVDLDPLQPGIQNIWIQGVGCGEANVTFE